MIRNYLTVIYRNLRRQLSYSLINIVGLAVGLACSLVIVLYVYGEWSYDRGYDQVDRIYRVGISFFNMGKFANGPEQLLNVLPQEFAGIETATRIIKDRRVPIRIQNEEFTEPVAYYSDSAFFKVFQHDFLSGNSKTALLLPRSAVVSDELAKKYFGTTQVLGKVMDIGKERELYTITGVVSKPTFNTHVNNDLWLSIQDQLTGDATWTSASCYTYVLLRKNTTPGDLEEALNKIIDNHVYEESGKAMGFKSLDEYKKNDNAVKFVVFPVKDIYLKSKLALEISPGGNLTNLYVFSAISFFILILAGVNFVNLTTARASRRAKEVGIRKALGTSRAKLIGQFLIESVLTTLVALVVALVLAELCLIVFDYATGSRLIPTVWASSMAMLFYFGFATLVGLVAGIYPAFFLTSFTPAKVLKGNTNISGGGNFRNLLVVFQFVVSISLIITTVIVIQQLHFMETKDLGFNQENEVTIDGATALGNSADVFKNELSREAGVTQASFHGGEPGSKRILTFNLLQTPAMESALSINTYFGDADYVTFMGFKLINGRTFSKDMASDTSGIILNEAAVNVLGLTKQPIGAVINKTQKVIGVVKDFHWESLRNAIGPTAIVLSKEKWEIGFRVNEHDMPSFLAKAEARWKSIVPDEPFQYHFMDENFGLLLEKEKTLSQAISFFAALAIFISCLGLYGLSAFTAEQRTKEIGIRKVLGASPSNIVVMLNGKFTRPVVIAIILAVPLSMYVVSRWLEGFAYQAPIGFWAFGGSILSALLIAWTTVSYHSIRAAIINPAETLKYE